MSDDVKKALERLKYIAGQFGLLSVGERPFEVLIGDLRMLLAHIDAGPERLAAAVAREREEQREACAQFCEEEYYDVPHSECAFADSLEAIRATPLTATPLKDELESMRKHMSFIIQNCQDYMAQVETLRARVKELERELEQAKASETVAWSDCEPTRQGPYGTVYVHDGCGACARCVDATRAERDDLKARLEELTGPVCTDAECPDHDGEHPYHFNAVALFWRRVEDTYENRNALCESAPVPPVQAWREERDAALARVKELEATLRRERDLFKETFFTSADKRAEKAEAERDELRQRILDSCPSPDEGGRIHAGGRIVCGQCHDSEVSHLRAQLAEATSEGTLSARIGVVREALGMSEFDSATEVGPINALKTQLAEAVEVLRRLREEVSAKLTACAFLEKHPEAK